MKKRTVTGISIVLLAGLLLAGCVANNEVTDKKETESGISKEDVTAEKEGEPDTSKEETAEDTGNVTKSSYHPLEHEYPESLMLFLARENGLDEAYDTDNIAKLLVSVDYGVQSQPLQTFTDPGVLKAFTDAINGMKVLGTSDEAFMTDNEAHYSVKDENDETMFYFSIQNGCLDGMYYLYDLEGLEALESIDEIMLAGDYQRYYDEHGEFPGE